MKDKLEFGDKSDRTFSNYFHINRNYYGENVEINKPSEEKNHRFY